MPEIAVNELSLRDTIRARESLFGSLDAKRPRAWEQYGYTAELTFEHYLNAYERGGTGHGAVHRILDKCWQHLPRIKKPGSDAETPWEKKLKATLTSIKGWQKLRDLDRRNMVGRYSGLIIRAADGQALDQPLVIAKKLVDLVPVYENQLEVTEWVTEPTREDFGQPAMWQYRMRPPQAKGTQAAPDQWVRVHPSRIIIMAEGSVGMFFEGVPFLKAGFNALVDIEKITGGSAESFLKNSARTLVLKYEANASVASLASNPGEAMPTGTALKDAIQAKTDALNQNTDSSLVMQGGDAHTLQTTISDPRYAFEVAANVFSASVQIPFTIQFGQQTGRLASDQDQRDMNARCTSRQVNEITPVLTDLVMRLQAAGLVEAGEFEIEWPPLDAPGDLERLKLVGLMADANLKDAQAGGDGLFDENEMRKVAKYEPKAGLDELPGEGGDDDEEPPTGTPAPAAPPAPVRRVV